MTRQQAVRPLVLRCDRGCHLGAVGRSADRRLMIAGARTATYAAAGGRAVRERAVIDSVVAPDDTFVAVGCDHWPGLAVDVEDLAGWVDDAAAGGRRVRIVRRGPS